MLLSIVIPAYDRPGALVHALDVFIKQIVGRYERDVEIIVTDDASPGNSLAAVAALAEKHAFLTFRRRDKNIGLERSLIAAAEGATGEYLWIFGDDDYLEQQDSLAEVMRHLRAGLHDMLVLNRTRRNTDLSKLLSPNWMRLGARDEEFAGLRDFCLKFGFISVIGFISVNVFRREAFLKVDPSPYMGTMYPQLGMMLEAFHDKPVRLLARPHVCHRTQTQEEKRAALGDKASEAAFMADAERRNALYFSHPYVNMLDRLVSVGAFRPQDITRIPENTVINGLLVQFLVDCLTKSEAHPETFSDGQWKRSLLFVGSLPLEPSHRQQLRDLARRRFGEEQGDLLLSLAVKAPAVAGTEVKTISVVSPSFNQAEFLDECLQSVANQTFAPIEHLVYDPGSKDGSRDVARKYKNISLFEEADEGQSDAINKGFRRARGDVVAWLNSDDVFADPTVFERVMRRFNAPDRPDIVYGRGVYIDEHGNRLRDVYLNKKPETLPWRLQQEDGILQPALFMRRSTIEKVGELNGGLHYCMDYEYWIRTIKAGIRWAYIDEDFALARYHSSNKTYGQRGKSYAEVCDMLVNHFGYANHVWLRRYAEFLSEGFDGVLAHAANTAVKNEGEIERHYVELLKAYNTSQPVYRMLEQKPSEKGYGDTLRELKRLGLGPSTPCKEVPLDRATEPGHVCYTVGPKRWAFDAAWKKKQIDKSHAFLRERIAKRDKDVCVIVGNGPSLKKSDLGLLKGQDVIISNNAFLEPRLLDCATYYTVVNYLVAEQSSHNINRLVGPAKVLPYWMAYCLNEGDNAYFVDAVGHAAFSKDMFKNMSWRHTVTFYNLHLAFGLGYKRAVMIGFDHFYKQSAEVKEGDIILTKTEDPNHFDSRYFRGKKWQAADVDMMEEMYRLAKAAYDEEGREIVNATVGGALELFPRMSLADALAMKPAPAARPAAGLIGAGPGTAASPAVAIATTAPKAAVASVSPSPAAPAAARAAAAPVAAPAPAAAFEFRREDSVRVDETEVIAAMLADRRGRGHLMLDVGAHFGTSAGYFDKLGWTIHCFEPDPSNRAKLVAKFGKSPNVSIDPRAVSEKPATGLPFFTSKESTGISGLHSFRDTHVQSNLVDATTVAEIINERAIKKIDFLKIDVEGFDFSVLKGVPWNTMPPDVIEAEFEDAKTVRLGHTYKEVCDYLVEKGYAVYLSEWHPIVRYGIPHDWRRVIKYPAPLATADAWGNILAFKVDPGLDAVVRAFQGLVRSSPAKPGAVKPGAVKPGAVKPVAAPPINGASPSAATATIAAAAKPAAPPDTGKTTTTAAATQPVAASTPAAAAAVTASPQKAAAATASAVALKPMPASAAKPPATSLATVVAAPSPARAAFAAPTPAYDRSLPLYTRIALWAKRKSPALFAIGQFFGWVLRMLKRYSVFALLLLLLIGGLVAAAVMLWPQLISLASAAAAAVVSILTLFGIGLGYARHIARRLSDERKVEQQIEISNLRRQLQTAEATSNTSLAALKSLLARVEDADVRLERMRPIVDTQNSKVRELEGMQTKLRQELTGISTRLGQLSQEATALARASTQMSGKLDSTGALTQRFQAEATSLGGRIAQLVSEFDGLMRRSDQVTVRIADIDELARSAGHEVARVSHRAEAAIQLAESAKTVGEQAIERLSEVEKGLGQSVQRIAKAEHALAQTGERLGKAERGLAESETRIAKAEQDMAQSSTRAITAEQALAQRIAKSEQGLVQAATMLESLSETAAKAQDDAGKTQAQLDAVARLVPPNNAVGYQAFNRMLRKADAEALATTWTRALSVAVDPRGLYYMANRVCALEASMRGRLATSVETMLLRTMVAMGVRRSDVHIVEIGTLFGIGAAVMYDALRPRVDNVHLTLIDPLDGYYSRSMPDILTGETVNERALRDNLAVAGVDADALTLIKRFSTDAEAIEIAAKRPIDVLVIDGDHSFSGVKADFDNYGRFVRTGGFIVFDDYDSPDWPDIKRYVDEQVRQLRWLASVGDQFRTAVFRVTRQPEESAAQSQGD